MPHRAQKLRQSQFWPACRTIPCARALRHRNSRLGKNRIEQGEGVFVSRSLTRTTPRENGLPYDELASGATIYSYALNNPINAFDSNGLKVTWYARPTQITGPFSFVNDLGITHQWIKTDTEEAGMGPAGGGVPGQGEPPDAPFTNVGTIDHTGQSNQPGAYSIPLPDDMDESCVNEMISPGRDLGKFIPGVNDCHTFVQQVISHCRLHKPLRLMPTL